MNTENDVIIAKDVMKEQGKFDWILPSIIGLILVKIFGFAGLLATFGGYYGSYNWLQPRIGTFGAVCCAAVLSLALGVGVTVGFSVIIANNAADSSTKHHSQNHREITNSLERAEQPNDVHSQYKLAEDMAFERVQLSYGISLEIPSHWEVLSQDAKQNLAAASESIEKNIGIVDDTEKKERLLAVSALPAPSGAKIRVSVTSPSELTQNNLSTVAESELNQLQPEFYSILNKMMASSELKILEMKPPRIERFNDKLALVISYTRTDAYGSSSWQVTQYKIPISNHRLIEFTLSYRLSDAIVWKPILENIKHSIKF